MAEGTRRRRYCPALGSPQYDHQGGKFDIPETPLQPRVRSLQPSNCAVDNICRNSPVWAGIESVGPLSRSEEHTSELQSHLNLVCRLLLEKKKTRKLQLSSTNKHAYLLM